MSEKSRREAFAELGEELANFSRSLRYMSIVREQQQGSFAMSRSILFALSEPQRAQHLAQKLGVGESAVSRQINALEAEGYLERTPDPQDKRAQHVALTSKGYEFVQEQREERAHSLQTALSHWDTEKISETTQALSEIEAMIRERLCTLKNQGAERD